MKKIVLASTSIYRKILLEKMGLEFSTEKPTFDEDAAKIQLLKNNKSPLEIAEALSKGKAQSIVAEGKLIIAGDQIVNLNGQMIGKAGSQDKAHQQLQQMNGQRHELITAVTLRTSEKIIHLNHITQLFMKNLSDNELKNYLKKDAPFDSAGSYKIEESGLLLFDKIETDDFSAIQGLPLIWISQQLKGMGYELFKR
ncbi:MAG: septum formation protein Maf [Bdellovibrio sp.]|nr:septum formation protein Maf [Bdellovibrio sp.]